MDTDLASTSGRRCGWRVPAVLLIAVLVVLSLARWSAPSDVYDNDQPGPMMHTIDVAANGAWLLQQDPRGRLATKPPMYPWLAALGVKATGLTTEWVHKLPSTLAFAMATLLVFDLGRRSVNPTVGLVAAALWATNFATFKLMYTARTDMLLAMWIILGVWSVQLQRQRWTRGQVSDVTLIALFWLAIAAGAMTKGPAIALAAIWFAMAAVIDRKMIGPHGKLLRWRWQLGAAALFLGLAGLWLWAALYHYPQWSDSIRAEVADRVTGTGTGEHRSTSMFAIPAYYLARFAPWSILFLVAAVTLIHVRGKVQEADTRQTLRRAAWGLGWVTLVVFFFMIPQGRRADYLLPAYAGGAVFAAAVVDAADRRRGLHRVLVHLLIGGVAIGALGSFSLYAAGPVRSGAAAFWAALATGSGIASLLTIHHRRYAIGAMAAALAVAGLLGVYDTTMSRSAVTNGGEQIHRLVREAAAIRERDAQPLVFLEVGYNPVQPLLGRNEPMDVSVLDRIAGSGLVIVGRTADDDGAPLPADAPEASTLTTAAHAPGLSAWQTLHARFPNRLEVLHETGMLPESDVALVLIRVHGKAP